MEEAPVVHEKHKKIGRAKICAAREEWDEADAIYDEILAEFPDDAEALNGKVILHRKKQKAEEEQRRQEEKRRRHEEKTRTKTEKSKSNKNGEILRSKRFVILLALVFLVACAVVAAILGIAAHRNSIDEMYSDVNAPVFGTCVISQTVTDA